MSDEIPPPRDAMSSSGRLPVSVPAAEFDRGAAKRVLTGCRVLMVEDQMINQMVLREILEHVGVHVTTANNGQEAITVMTCEAGRFDLVLMDLQMPVLDGYEATRILREEWSADQLPIIAVTAHALQEDRQHCLQVGMNDHLTKPVEQDQLYVCMIKWLKGSCCSGQR
jgi:two-component system, sensor histidine kinase and response regulator